MSITIGDLTGTQAITPAKQQSGDVILGVNHNEALQGAKVGVDVVATERSAHNYQRTFGRGWFRFIQWPGMVKF